MKDARSAAFRPDIDGLRAIAIVPVVLFHARVEGVTGGFLGVDVFFVISGYLITGLIAHEIIERKFTYLSFWERRARRLLPPLFVVVAFSSLAAHLILLPEELKAFGESVVSISPLFIERVFLAQNGLFRSTSANDPASSHLVSGRRRAVLSIVPRGIDGCRGVDAKQ